MKKRIIRAAIAAVLIFTLLICLYIEAQSRIAKIDPVVGDPFKEPVKIRCTCYCEHGVTGTGKKNTLWHCSREKRVARLYGRAKRY